MSDLIFVSKLEIFYLQNKKNIHFVLERWGLKLFLYVFQSVSDLWIASTILFQSILTSCKYYLNSNPEIEVCVSLIYTEKNMSI